MLALLPASVPSLLPASFGSRGYANVFGTFLVPSSQNVYAMGAAEVWCEECGVFETPESVSDIAAAIRYGFSGWFLPCHESECSCCYRHGRTCWVCNNVDECCSCSTCEVCEDRTADYCESCDLCSSCCECVTCADCGYRFDTDSVTWVGNDAYCDRRCISNFGFCEECDTYYDYDYSHEHDHNGCECLHADQRFAFPNGDGTVRNDSRIYGELPSGQISSEGVYAISEAVVSYVYDMTYEDRPRYGFNTVDGWEIRNLVNSLDPTWQTRQGNYTRRLAKVFYQKWNWKVPPSLLSQIGNLANQHTQSADGWRIELTRALNGSASDFYHSDSCWWQSYAHSRCALKNWGGIGIRSYDSDHGNSNRPTGRAWLQPLRFVDSEDRYGNPIRRAVPTSDIGAATAFVVYNGYGDLAGYAAVRIIAHMTGKTYRKIGLSMGSQYVNGDVGYLISDSQTCEKVESIDVRADDHATF